MKIGKRDGSGAAVRGPVGGVTASNYVDRAKAFIAGNGGEGFVIRAREGAKGSLATGEPATEAQWIAWIRYFEARGIFRNRSGQIAAFAKSFGMATVPAEWPELFDLEAETSDRLATLPTRRPLAPFADRQRGVAMLKATGERLAKLADPLRRPKPKPPELWELDAAYRDVSLSLSAEARRAAGFPALHGDTT
jgi:hypothetical protein